MIVYILVIKLNTVKKHDILVQLVHVGHSSSDNLRKYMIKDKKTYGIV
jgi:hypothetical protein